MRTQTRRSISIRGLSYQRLKKYCEEANLTMSGMVESLIMAELDRLDRPTETELETKYVCNSPKKDEPDDFLGSHFSF